MGRRHLLRPSALKSELQNGGPSGSSEEVEKGLVGVNGNGLTSQRGPGRQLWIARTSYAATFLLQPEVTSRKEWKILRRDKTPFFLHVAVASVLGVFCGRSFGS